MRHTTFVPSINITVTSSHLQGLKFHSPVYNTDHMYVQINIYYGWRYNKCVQKGVSRKASLPACNYYAIVKNSYNFECHNYWFDLVQDGHGDGAHTDWYCPYTQFNAPWGLVRSSNRDSSGKTNYIYSNSKWSVALSCNYKCIDHCILLQMVEVLTSMWLIRKIILFNHLQYCHWCRQHQHCSGIDTSHPDFQGCAIWGTNTVDTLRTDDDGHGTHVAGNWNLMPLYYN